MTTTRHLTYKDLIALSDDGDLHELVRLILAHISKGTQLRGSVEERGTDQRGRRSTMDEADWAINEFGAALLGDSRRTARLIALASVLAQRPEVSLPAACDDPAMRKGAYWFFENAATEPAAIRPARGRLPGSRWRRCRSCWPSKTLPHATSVAIGRRWGWDHCGSRAIC